MHEADKEHM